MLKLTRLLILISVAILAARPVMACCLTGHDAPTISDNQPEAPPCHGEAPATHDATAKDTTTDRTPVDCPGCFDCDAAIMQAPTVDDGVLLSQQPNEIPIAVLASRFQGFEHASIVLKTGPPGDPPSLIHTPISLKQRLLI